MTPNRRSHSNPTNPRRPTEAPPGGGVDPGLVGELVEVSHWAGRRADLIQAGGGNTSVKSTDGRVMLLKASGYGLAEVLPPGEPGGPRGYVAMDTHDLRRLLDREDLLAGDDAEARLRASSLAACTFRAGPEVRPSVEALLHVLLGRVVIHTHPPTVVALVSSAHRRAAEERFRQVLGEAALFLPYRNPGLERARELRQALARSESREARPRVLLLENHGLFVWAETTRAAKRLTTRCLRAAREVLGVGPRARGPSPASPRPSKGWRAQLLRLLPLVRGAACRASGRRLLVRFHASAAVASLARTERGRRALRAGPLSPDEVVYCHSHPLALDLKKLGGQDEKARDRLVALLARYRKRHRVFPKVLLAAPRGYFILAESERSLRAAREQSAAALEAKLHSLRLGGPRPLAAQAAAFIEGWEAEAYRRRLAGAAEASLPLAAQVAVVTGAGSGLGRGIARGLARAGATVALVDIDEPAARSAARETLAETSAGHAPAFPADVTDEAAVSRLFEEVVLGCGGVDILVNAAGIAPSYPLVEFPLPEWERTLKVNLTGYFLCAREAARWMVREGTGGNIINLSSKTGLEASVDNSAYNATKAAEIHLARGWARELAPAGIRVNALAPGNVFEGSRIWNRRYIEACARKRGVSPEEVIPYYINLTALKREIKPEDVAQAVVFLCSERARVITGQTLVPDAGQVFVR